MLERYTKEWNYFCNYPHNENGRIWLLWRTHVDIQILNVHEQFVHYKVKDINSNFTAVITVIYAKNLLAQRLALWSELKNIGANMQEAWMLSGDFNNLLTAYGRIGQPVVHLMFALHNPI